MSDKFHNFLEKANKIHNGFYSYNKSKYINARNKITITCPVHGDFEQLPYNHLIGKGCNKCSVDRNKNLFTKKLDDFITRSNEVHNFKYDYRNYNYINDSTKVEIICPKHGSFYQLPKRESFDSLFYSIPSSNSFSARILPKNCVSFSKKII
jgi:hypothetical protein